jgi:hypothetical protein
MRLIVAIFFLPILAVAQEASPLVARDNSTISPYLRAYSQAEGGMIRNTQDVESFIYKIVSKRGSFRTEKEFLKYVFTKTHHRYLKHYEEYASFNNLLTGRSYNCLTGTALYALILKELDVPFEIFETNYHIFLLASTDAGNVLFEATDPLKGFIDTDREIEARIKIYKQNLLPRASNTDKTLYRFKVDLYNRITLEGIIGLLHYNLAVEAYNRQDLRSSISHLDKAILLYQSSRIEEFSKIILLSVMESKLERSEKETYLRKIQSIRQRKMPAIASSQSYQ